MYICGAACTDGTEILDNEKGGREISKAETSVMRVENEEKASAERENASVDFV